VLLLTILGALVMLANPASAQPEQADLLRALQLGDYSRGEQPPAFNARTADRRRLSLADLRGKVVVITFWATWCQPCREEMQIFDRLHRELAGEGLTVVAVNTREDEAPVVEFGRALSLGFSLVLDPQGEVGASYGVVGLPTTFLIARDGRAVARAIGARDWTSPPARALIRSLLSEAGSRR
jgi:thiol-disulfide isomerase/thioredoxin